VFFALTALVFTLVGSKWTSKPLLIITLLVSSMTAYFMNTYNVVIDADMIRNTLQTDMKESLDLLSVKQAIYFLFLGLFPSFLVYIAPVEYSGFKRSLWLKLKQVLLLLLLMSISIFAFSKYYTSFVREHKSLRYSTNPVYWIYSIGNYIQKTVNSGPIVVTPTGLDAKIVKTSQSKPRIVIMVVGEAARADHFSLNGYKKETNPLLKKAEILNFPNVFSCGTATAKSVPCMFSIYDKAHYSYKKGRHKENVLDVLKHTNQVSLLWRDNNSNSKGVALRIPYENYKYNNNNTLCDNGECRDIGMLVGLDTYIEAQKDKDILIVLHQMGNHGPAYYKRYPPAFEKFTPICKTNQLEKCSKEEISNAYDNALLYTDTFLNETINLLKKYTNTHKTAMLYMSDHGESLGEKGVYLHGLPYFMAPDAQIHIGTILWMNKSLKDEVGTVDTTKHYTQDNLFHTLLGLFNVQTKVYKKEMDMLNI
jgi:lipid A ethanolaminephosphotransferase